MKVSSRLPNASSFAIDHLGTVAGVIDDIGLVEEINHLVGTHSLEHIDSGQLVKAMVLNGFGSVSAPLSLFGEFFAGKATERLVGDGVTPEVLTDDKLARVLDALVERDLTRVFVTVAAKACQAYGVRPSTWTRVRSACTARTRATRTPPTRSPTGTPGLSGPTSSGSSST